MIRILKALLIGIGIGILIAPNKGKKTRKKIVDKLSNCAEEVNDFISGKAKTVKTQLDKAENLLEDI